MLVQMPEEQIRRTPKDKNSQGEQRENDLTEDLETASVLYQPPERPHRFVSKPGGIIERHSAQAIAATMSQR